MNATYSTDAQLTFDLEKLAEAPLTTETVDRLLAGLRHPTCYVREGALYGCASHLRSDSGYGLNLRTRVREIAENDPDEDVREIARDMIVDLARKIGRFSKRIKMADRTSAALFGKIFRYLAATATERDREFAKWLMGETQSYDFATYQMDADDALRTLGIDPEEDSVTRKLRAVEADALAGLRRTARAGGWVCLAEYQHLQQGLRQLHTMGLLERTHASGVVPGYRRSKAWAYRLLRKEEES
jgi:hypothetical protein